MRNMRKSKDSWRNCSSFSVSGISFRLIPGTFILGMSLIPPNSGELFLHRISLLMSGFCFALNFRNWWGIIFRNMCFVVALCAMW